MQFRKILKSTAAIVVPPPVRVLPTLLQSVAKTTPGVAKAGATSQ